MKGATAKFAQEHGIRTEKLPITENIQFSGRQVLAVNHVGELIVHVVNGLSWTDALMSVIPPRKNPQPVHPTDQTEDVSEKSSFCDIA